MPEWRYRHKFKEDPGNEIDIEEFAEHSTCPTEWTLEGLAHSKT